MAVNEEKIDDVIADTLTLIYTSYNGDLLLIGRMSRLTAALERERAPRRIACDVCDSDMMPGRICVACTLKVHGPLTMEAILKVAEEMESMEECHVWKKPYLAIGAWVAELRRIAEGK